ncbi:glypican-4 [Trichogramma pretiosum]|uniref:glypican-4 n=1 Tax=Trichogramma pretiosum TaxID=7493 RepID=UPI0006C9405E|nr:glypican-4 [Trichogramma pretiosum]
MIIPIIMLLTLSHGAISTLSASTAVSSSTLSCDSVRPYFMSKGFQSNDIPKGPVSSRELKTCGGIRNGGEVCCSPDMETRLQTWATNNFNKATKDTLLRLQNIFHNRATKVHDFFNNLLKMSKKNFHEMFKKTYGILYEQNSYVFLDLFRELEKYYVKGAVDLDDIMDSFFNTLYQKMFTVLNSQYKFDNKYLECVGNLMKEMKPFGDVPQKLGVQIKRSFIATRAFSQALQVASDVLKNMQELKTSNDCAQALTRMTACPSCSGVSSNILACNDMCENVMKGCLAQHAALDVDWNHFVEAVDKIADRLLGPFNIEMLVRPINLKISEAIMNFQESSSDVSQRVFKGCGRPVLGRRRRRSRPQGPRDEHEIDDLRSLSFEEEDEPVARASKSRGRDRGEERSSSAVALDKLVKEIKQRIRDSRQFWLYLPYKLCNDGLASTPSNTNHCWNGTHIDKYIYPVSPNGETQNMNPEVQAKGPRTAIVKEQMFALGSITNRLRLAFNGNDVDWIDNEDSWRETSGSGSGAGGIETISEEDEDEDDREDDLVAVVAGRDDGSGSGNVATTAKSREESELEATSAAPRLTPAPTTPMTTEPTRPEIIVTVPTDHGVGSSSSGGGSNNSSSENNVVPHVILVGSSATHCELSFTILLAWLAVAVYMSRGQV